MPASDSGTAVHRLGRYHLSECLGGGPTGEVYRAKVYGIAGMERDFAVKRFHPSFVVGSAAAAEIAVAAQLYGSLDHPKVAKLQELGVSGEHTFTAVEFVPGVDLSQIMDHGQLPLGAAARLVVQICRAIGYVHSRGLTHLGIAPTNVICSERGEIKVTDFGFLAPRLPKRPAEDISLLARLCYLAPEQLEGKPVSAATDVYQLGTLAFELMVGRKPYAGRSGIALANQMLRGSVPESGLAPPYQKVLQRALARNPFERFTDAGSMADAIEAALRASPAEGTLNDVGVAVTEREVFLASSRETQASGALRFPMPAPPTETRSVALKINTPPPPIPRSGNSSLARLNLKKKSVPQGIQEKISAKSPGSTENNSVQAAMDVQLTPEESERDTVPTMDAPVMDTDPGEQDAPGLLLGPAGTDPAATMAQFIGGEERQQSSKKTMVGGHAIARTPPPPVPIVTAAVSEVDDDDLESLDDEFDDVATQVQEDEPASQRVAQAPPLETPEAQLEISEAQLEISEAQLETPESLVGREGAALPPKNAAVFPPRLEDVNVTPPPMHGEAAKGGLPGVVKYAGMAAIVGGFAFLSFSLLASDDDKKKAEMAQDSSTSPDALANSAKTTTAVKEDPSSATTATQDAAVAVDPAATADTPADSGALDAAATAVAIAPASIDAAVAAAPTEPSLIPTPTKNGGLQVESVPPGAKVYLDGSLVGNTPMQLESSADNHRLALVLEGYALYTGDVDGKGLFKIDLSEVVPPGGPGGIKVRCKQANRYYVFVDGKAIGQLCPTERIGVSRGKHVVEIYDPVTDARREFNVDVVDTRLSVRVRVD